MTKTTNYQLPQWSADDPVRREDFNGAFAAIDKQFGKFLTPGGKTAQCGTFTFGADTETGGEVLSFGFEPQCVLLGVGMIHLVISGSTGTISITGGGTTYTAVFFLTGSKLTMLSKDSRITATYTVKYVAVP